MTGDASQVVQDRVPQARIYKVWNIPAVGTATPTTWTWCATCSRSGKNSRLYKRLVYDDQIATERAVPYIDAREIGGQFSLRHRASRATTRRKWRKPSTRNWRDSSKRARPPQSWSA